MALRARRQRRAPQPTSAPVVPGPSCKICPRCGSTLFADMDMCYDCLYDFNNPGLDYSGSGAPYGPMGDLAQGTVMMDGYGSIAPPSGQGSGNAEVEDPFLGYGMEPASTVGPEIHREDSVPVPQVQTESVRSVELETAMPVEPHPIGPVGSESAVPFEAKPAMPVGSESDLSDEGAPIPSEAVEVAAAIPSAANLSGRADGVADGPVRLGQDTGLFADPSETPAESPEGGKVQLGVLVRWRGLEMTVPLADGTLSIGRDRANDVAIASFDVPAFAVEIVPDGEDAILRLLAEGIEATLDDEPVGREVRMGAGQEAALFGARLSLVRIDD